MDAPDRELRNDDVVGLVSSAMAGDRRAWDLLVEEFAGTVWTVARSHRLSAADAADVAQATWLRFVEHIERLRDPGRVGPWLATTARRESLRVLRRASMDVPFGDDGPPEPSAPEAHAAEAIAKAERDQALWRSFERLRASDQALLRMLIADRRPSYEAIAAALNRPIGSIGPTRARALDRLRHQLTRDGAMALVQGGA